MTRALLTVATGCLVAWWVTLLAAETMRGCDA